MLQIDQLETMPIAFIQSLLTTGKNVIFTRTTAVKGEWEKGIIRSADIRAFDAISNMAVLQIEISKNEQQIGVDRWVTIDCSRLHRLQICENNGTWAVTLLKDE